MEEIKQTNAYVLCAMLTDGSFVFDVVIDDGYGSSINIPCVDEKAAWRLVCAINDNTNIAVSWASVSA